MRFGRRKAELKSTVEKLTIISDDMEKATFDLNQVVDDLREEVRKLEQRRLEPKTI